MFHVLVATHDQVAGGYGTYVMEILTRAYDEESAQFSSQFTRGMTFRQSKMLVYGVGIGGPDWIMEMFPGDYGLYILMNDSAMELASKAGLKYNKVGEIPEAKLPEHQRPLGFPIWIEKDRLYLT